MYLLGILQRDYPGKQTVTVSQFFVQENHINSMQIPIENYRDVIAPSEIIGIFSEFR